MAAQYCTLKIEELIQLIYLHGTLVLTICVFNLTFSLVATLGNLLIIRAMWKASSIPENLKTSFLSLAFSDLGMRLFAQLMFGVNIAVMLRMASNGNYNFQFFCPTVLALCYFSLFLLACASFLNITAIAVDRLLVICLHLRYRELVTSKRVITALVSLWLISTVAASLFISLCNRRRIVIVIMEIVGLLFTTKAYFRIHKVVRHQHNQIQVQIHLANAQAMELLREKKSPFSALLVYALFISCYLPQLCSAVLSETNDSFQARFHVTLFFALLNSSLNPFVYC